MSEDPSRMSTQQQLEMFGCDLVDLLRREGLHSGVWFGKRLLQAADAIETLHAASVRPCTCHPDDRTTGPCPRRYAATECQQAAQGERA